MSKLELIEQIGKLSDADIAKVEALLNEILPVDIEERRRRAREAMGSMRGQLTMTDDFHKTPEGFEDYM